MESPRFLFFPGDYTRVIGPHIGKSSKNRGFNKQSRLAQKNSPGKRILALKGRGGEGGLRGRRWNGRRGWWNGRRGCGMVMGGRGNRRGILWNGLTRGWNGRRG